MSTPVGPSPRALAEAVFAQTRELYARRFAHTRSERAMARVNYDKLVADFWEKPEVRELESSDELVAVAGLYLIQIGYLAQDVAEGRYDG